MRIYYYKSVNEIGNIVRGKHQCSDLRTLSEYLSSKGELLIKASYRKRWAGVAYGGSLSSKQLSLLCKQIASILDAGIPILDAIIMASVNFKGRLQENLIGISASLKKGNTLYEAISSFPRIYPSFLINMIKIGEKSGKIDNLFLQLSDHYYNAHKLKQKIINACIYPALILVISFILVFILMTTVVPPMMDMIISSNGEIPPITMFILRASTFLKNNSIFIIISITLFTPCFIYISSYYKIDFYVAIKKITILNCFYHRIVSHNFLRGIYIVYSSGGSILEALEYSCEIIRSKHIRNQVIQAVSKLKTGDSMYAAFACIDIFDYVTLSLLKIGESTGKLDKMLEKAIEILEDDISRSLDKATQLIQPIALVLVAAIVGVLVLAITLPMFSMYNAI